MQWKFRQYVCTPVDLARITSMPSQGHTTRLQPGPPTLGDVSSTLALRYQSVLFSDVVVVHIRVRVVWNAV